MVNEERPFLRPLKPPVLPHAMRLVWDTVPRL